MAQTLSELITTTINLINAGSLADPLSSRTGDYAFSDELRLSGQFPKIFVKPPEQPTRDMYTFGPSPEYEKPAILDIFVYVKLTKENIYSDTLGSYKNEGLVIRLQELIEDMINDNISVYHQIGFHNPRITAMSEVVPYRETGMFGGAVTVSFMTRKYG